MKNQIKITLSWNTLEEKDIKSLCYPRLTLTETESPVSRRIRFNTWLVGGKPIVTDEGNTWYNRDYELSSVTDVENLNDVIERLYRRFESCGKQMMKSLDEANTDVCKDILRDFRECCDVMKSIELKKLNGTPIKASRKEIMQELRHESQISRMMM